MTDKEQIEEMAAVICAGRVLSHSPELVAEDLFELSYRKVKRGEWIKKDDPILGAFYGCSSCKCEWFTDGLCSSENENNLNFCPNCGADMRGEGK